jgi:acyl carrier protein
MVPASFVVLDEFPLTPNNKVDRRALPAPDQSRPDLAEAYVAPRTATESVLAEFWQDALGLERIGVNDNFIELGGDSLAAVDIFLRIGEKFDVDFPLHVFFQVPTIAGLAGALERRLAQPVMEPARAAVSVQVM